MFVSLEACDRRDHLHVQPYRICWARVSCYIAGPALNQDWFNVLCLPEVWLNTI